MYNKNQGVNITREEFRKSYKLNGTSWYCPDCGSELKTIPFEDIREEIKPFFEEILKEEPYKGNKVDFVVCRTCKFRPN